MFANRTIIVWAFGIALLVTGCTASVETYLPIHTANPSRVLLTTSSTLTLPSTQISIATVTAVNSRTYTPVSQIATSTLTLIPPKLPSTSTPTLPTPTQTMTPAPTLTDVQRKAYFSDLLKDNAGCGLPCWWGITPGVTLWEEARNVILPLSINYKIPDYLHADGTIYHVSGFDWHSPFTISNYGFYDDGGIVQAIFVSTVGYEDKAFFRELWKSYSPDQIMAAYGPPEEVYVSASSGGIAEISLPGASVLLKYKGEFWIWYDVEPIMINELERPVFRVCPSWQDITWGSRMDLYIKADDYPITLDELIGIISSVDLTYMKPIYDAAGITAEEFYQRFLPGQGPACIDTPQDLWK